MPTKRSSLAGVLGRSASVSAGRKDTRRETAGAKRKAAVSKKAKADAYTAATQAVMDMREEKWFHPEDDQQFYPQVPTSGPKRCSVMAFATTSNLDPADPTNVLTYCGRAIKNLDMLRPYDSGAGAQLAPYKIEGKHVYPTFNRVNWSINRIYARLGLNSIATDYVGIPPAPGVNDLSLIHSLPVRCRIIRVTPKIAPGVTTVITPSTDLFMDQRGLAYSPEMTNFSYSDLENASVNTRKYTVLGDAKFTLTAPFTASWVPIDSPQAPHGRWTQHLQLGQGSHVKRINTTHQLSQKKGGAVYYEDPDAQTTNNATSGHRREYIFMHFWFDNNDGGGDTPSLAGTGLVPDEEDIKVHWRTESRFKEA